MSEFNYLTGRKELFDNAPPEAMVVLETNDGQIYYAVSHNRGAQYWYDNGNPGRPIGLIALFEKTRVVASRARIGGCVPAVPSRPAPASSRLDRMQQAQDGLKKAVSQPAPVAPKREAKPAVCREVLREQGKPYPKSCPVHGLKPCVPKPEAAKLESPRIEPKVDLSSPAPAGAAGRVSTVDAGFVSAFDMSFRIKSYGTPGITLYKNGNLGLSSNLFEVGDLVDVQVNAASCIIRVGKVKTGGRVVKKSRVFSGKALVRLIGIPEGSNSLRINLTEQDGWFVGTFTKVEGGK